MNLKQKRELSNENKISSLKIDDIKNEKYINIKNLKKKLLNISKSLLLITRYITNRVVSDKIKSGRKGPVTKNIGRVENKYEGMISFFKTYKIFLVFF